MMSVYVCVYVCMYVCMYLGVVRNRMSLRGGGDDRNCFADMMIDARQQTMFGVVRNRMSLRGGGDDKV